MRDVTLQELLEAGCHFGHKAERWHPKAHGYIYTEKDGVHIIDLAKTREGLMNAAEAAYNIGKTGRTLLFVATKRQATDVVTAEAREAGAPYLTERWIGGFLTNWDSIKKNIDRINRMTDEQARGLWKKFPKHEQFRLARILKRLNVFYGGVLELKNLPDAVFIVDIRKEDSAVREAKRRNLPVLAVVDTNTNPDDIDYQIPANDDAVGSIALLTKTIAQAYKEGREEMIKEQGIAEAASKAAAEKAALKAKEETAKEVPVVKVETETLKPGEKAKPESVVHMTPKAEKAKAPVETKAKAKK